MKAIPQKQQAPFRVKTNSKTKPKYKLTLNEFIETKSQMVAVCMHPNNHTDPFHNHEFFEINYVKKGKCKNLVEETLIEMKKGDFIIIHPGTYHTLYSTNNCEIYNFLISAEWFAFFLSSYPEKSNGPFSRFVRNSKKATYDPYIYFKFSKNMQKGSIALANKITYLHTSKKSDTYLLTEAYLMHLLATLPMECDEINLPNPKESDTDVISVIQLYMHDNYSTVTLEELSLRFKYTKTHICRLFKEEFNRTFNEILTEIKLDHAKIYLENTDKKVYEISYLLGYESVEYFIRLFKKHTNYTPSHYREQFYRKTFKAEKTTD